MNSQLENTFVKGLKPGLNLSERSANAEKFLEQLSFPGRKDENWRYTSVKKLAKLELAQVADVAKVNISDYAIPELDCVRLLFVNGVFDQSQSDEVNISGITVKRLSELTTDTGAQLVGSLSNEKEEIFDSINLAYLSDGVMISIEKNTEGSKPVHIIHVTTQSKSVSNTRNIIVAEQSASLKVVESFHSTDCTDALINHLTEITVKENASVQYDKLQVEEGSNNYICKEEVKQLRDSRFTINTFSLKGKLVRNDLNIKVDGEHCETYLNGLFLPVGEQHIDNHTRVDHLKSNCMSSELYKGTGSGRSTSVFNGKVIVHVDAQKIEAFQQNNNILLSDEATINAKPELEIYADDVKCSHGTTTGQFDKDAIFYLRARGVGEKAAKSLLVAAFANEVIEKLENPSLESYLQSFV